MTEYEYGEFPTFSIGYGDGYEDVYIFAIILVPAISPFPFKLLKGLNTFLVLIFVVFVADGPHFHIMFKMVLIFTKCLEWSSFSQFVFYLVLFYNVV